MTLQVYPADPKPSYSYVLDHQFRTLVSEFESGKENRRSMWRFPKRTFSLIYRVARMTDAERNVLYEFYETRKGSYEAFWFFDFIRRKWIDQYVGYGNGSAAVFDLPSMTTTQFPRVFVAGVERTRVSHWNFLAGGGQGGADRIQFTAGNIPGAGQLITTNLEGFLRIKGRFKDDKMTEELFTVDLTNISINIFELKG